MFGRLGATRCRPFERGDRSACLEVFASNVPDYFRAEEREEFERFLADLPGPYLVVERPTGVLGCGGYALRQEEGVADLCWGMVHRDHHGAGLGMLLTTERLERALRDPRVRVVALSTSQLTVGFYEKLGFRVVRVEPEGYGPGLDRCEMRLDTGAAGKAAHPGSGTRRRAVRPSPDSEA